MNEKKIREAYVACRQFDTDLFGFYAFRAGYMALLNDLITVGDPDDPLYMLPEGVEP